MTSPSPPPPDPTPQAADFDRTIDGQRVEGRGHGQCKRQRGKILWTF